MRAFAIFSRHAFERIEERTCLRYEEIALLLDAGRVVNTGSEPGFSRRHLLFYSQPDDDFFIAIQDAVIGTVVTILPLEYHRNLAWDVTAAQCEQAKQLALLPIEKTAEFKIPPSVFIVKVQYLAEDGRQKTKVVARVPSAPYTNDLTRLIKSGDLYPIADDGASSAGITPDSVIGFSAQLGNYGTSIFLFDRALPQTA